MTSLPDGHSATTESRRQVMVVEGDPERCRYLCTLLTHHGLRAHSTRPAEFASTVQGWPGVILVGDSESETPGWKVAERIRSFDTHVPIILLGTVTAASSATPPTVQACLPPEVSDARLVQEVERWLQDVDRSPPAHPNGPLGPILLIDDEPLVCQILQRALERKGFSVVTATSGEEGLRQLARIQPRVVLLDIKMPGMDGILTLKHLRTTCPTLPVVMVSQLDEKRLKEEAGKLGVDDYLVKPLNIKQLETLLRTRFFPEAGIRSTQSPAS